MTTQEAGSGPHQLELGVGLAERIEGQIVRRASGRIRDLQVHCSDELIVLLGRSRTHHAKQLAQEAVLDFLDGHHALANQIVVS